MKDKQNREVLFKIFMEGVSIILSFYTVARTGNQRTRKRKNWQ